MERSDLSGKPIEGDAAKRIVCVVDGRRTKLTVTAAEAAGLLEKGQDVTSAGQSFLAKVRPNLGRIAKWGAALLIGSLAIPAVTKQWSDRQAELQLKSSLVSDVSKESVTAFRTAQRIRATHGAQADRLRQGELDKWDTAHGVIGARYDVYFPNSGTNSNFNAYGDAVYAYIGLACCDDRRNNDVNDLLGYAYAHRPQPDAAYFGHGDRWHALRCGPSAACGVSASQFGAAYEWLGHELNDYRPSLLEDLRRAHAAGFSRGPGAFARDAFAPIVP